MDRRATEAWWATTYQVTKSQTQVSNLTTTTIVCFFFKDLMLLKKQNTILKIESRANPKMAEE